MDIRSPCHISQGEMVTSRNSLGIWGRRRKVSEEGGRDWIITGQFLLALPGEATGSCQKTIFTRDSFTALSSVMLCLFLHSLCKHSVHRPCDAGVSYFYEWGWRTQLTTLWTLRLRISTEGGQGSSCMNFSATCGPVAPWASCCYFPELNKTHWAQAEGQMTPGWDYPGVHVDSRRRDWAVRNAACRRQPPKTILRDAPLMSVHFYWVHQFWRK